MNLPTTSWGASPEDAFEVYINDFESHRELWDKLSTTTGHETPAQANTRKNVAGISDMKGLIIYLIIRMRKPSTVLETGVAAGVSSTYILRSLEDNKLGRLHSIDLPPEEVIGKTLPDALSYDKLFVSHKEPGWLVPDSLRKRWSLEFGDVKQVLPDLVRRLRQIDFYFNDDLRVPEHMFWEFQMVWPFLSKNGIVLVDDINYGYCNFVRKYLPRANPWINCGYLGGFAKR